MNLEKRQRIKHGNGLNDTEWLKNRFLKRVTMLNCEEDTFTAFEYVLSQNKYTDSIPVHVGAWILSSSKLHVLKVISAHNKVFY